MTLGHGLILVFLGQSIINPRYPAVIGKYAIYSGYILLVFGVIEFALGLIVLFSKRKSAVGDKDAT